MAKKVAKKVVKKVVKKAKAPVIKKEGLKGNIEFTFSRRASSDHKRNKA